MDYYYVKCAPAWRWSGWSGPWLTAHQAGCVAMTFDGIVYTEREFRAAIEAEGN